MRRTAIARALFPLLLAAASACGSGSDGASEGRRVGARGASAAPATPRQWIVLVDLSGSRASHMLVEGKSFLKALVERIGYGDEIVLIEVHQGSATENVQRWSGSVPPLEDPTFETVRDRQRLEGVRQGALAVVDEFFEREARAANTDILSTLHVVAEYVRDANGRRPVLIVLSDMLQSANGIEMERLRRMPEAGWIEAQREAGLIPELPGVCVGVIGADATTSNGAAVRKFWMDYFAAAGAELNERNYRIVAPAAGALGC